VALRKGQAAALWPAPAHWSCRVQRPEAPGVLVTHVLMMIGCIQLLRLDCGGQKGGGSDSGSVGQHAAGQGPVWVGTSVDRHSCECSTLPASLASVLHRSSRKRSNVDVWIHVEHLYHTDGIP
jgi:hypothetical protein